MEIDLDVMLEFIFFSIFYLLALLFIIAAIERIASFMFNPFFFGLGKTFYKSDFKIEFLPQKYSLKEKIVIDEGVYFFISNEEVFFRQNFMKLVFRFNPAYTIKSKAIIRNGQLLIYSKIPISYFIYVGFFGLIIIAVSAAMLSVQDYWGLITGSIGIIFLFIIHNESKKIALKRLHLMVKELMELLKPE